MPVAVIVRLDDVTDSHVDTLMQALPDRPVRRRPAHIRLATYDDEVDVAGLDEAMAQVVRTWRRLSATLVGIIVFPGDPSSLSLLPIPIDDLLRWHLGLDEALIPVTGRHCYEHGIWTPYVSLGPTGLPADAVEVLTTLWQEPIEARLDRIELVRLGGFETISSRMLPG